VDKQVDIVDNMSMRSIKYRQVALECFDGTIITFVLVDESRVYVPIRHMSEALGVNPSSQIERFKEDSRFTIEELPLQTRGKQVPNACGRRKRRCGSSPWIQNAVSRRCVSGSSGGCRACPGRVAANDR
jgi:hypothetical protein